MTREELAEEIAFMLTEHRADGVLADHTADAVIRLVVEACCKKLEQEAEELGDEGDLYAGAYLSAEADLRRTFLPTTEPTDG